MEKHIIEIIVVNKKYNFIIKTKYKPNKGQIGTCLSHIKVQLIKIEILIMD